MSTDYNERAAKGQAYNLAVNRAIAEGVVDDTRTIFKYFLEFYDLGNLIQKTSYDEIKTIVEETDET